MNKTLRQIASIGGSILVIWYVSTHYEQLKSLAAK
jgi:hypothetical protein